MSRIFLFFAVFVLFFSVLTADGKESETKRSNVLGHEPIFSADIDIFLGQKSRRRSGGGRVWTNLYYGDTTLKPKAGKKISPDLYGIQVGFDITQSHGEYSTFFINVNQSKLKFAPGGSSTIDNYLLGYGKFVYLGLCHFGYSGSIGYDQYEISSGGYGNGDGLQMNFFGEFGLDFIFDKWGIKPFYALQYDFLYHGNVGDSSIRDWNGHGLNQLLGLRLNWKVTDMLELQGRTVWVHEMLDHPPPFYHVRFSPVHGTNSPAIMFYEGNTGRDWAWLGLGAKLGVYNVYLFLDYDLLINKYHATHLGSLGLCLGW